MLDSFRSVTGTPIHLDTANGWIADVRLNAGDINGRTITVEITDNGLPVTADGLSCRLLYNANPGVSVGDRIDMTKVDDASTATFTAAMPRAAISKPGNISLGIEIDDGDTRICSRTFRALVERAVLDPEASDADDTLGQLEQLIADAETATGNANTAAESATTAAEAANSAAQAANEAAETANTAASNANKAAETATAAATNVSESITAATNAAQAANTAADAANTAASAATTAATAATDATTAATEATTAATAAASSATNAAETANTAANAANTAATAANALVDEFDVTAGPVTTGEPDSDAAASITRTGNAFAVNLTIPKGQKGDPGDPGAAATVTIGTVTTGEAGSQAAVTNSGTDTNAILDITLPKGDKGDGLQVSYVSGDVASLPTSDVAAGTMAMVSGVLYGWDGSQWREQGDITGGAKLDEYYTKEESDGRFAMKTDLIDSYSRAESDSRYAQAANVYDKATADSTFAAKTDIVDSYTKTESDERYAAAENVYDRETADSTFASKAEIPDAYTKSETYSSTQIDSLMANVAGKTRMQQVTFEAALFADTTAIQLSGLTLGAVNLISAVNNEDNLTAVAAANPRFYDNADDSTIPVGTIQCEVSATPSADMVFTVLSFDAASDESETEGGER